MRSRRAPFLRFTDLFRIRSLRYVRKKAYGRSHCVQRELKSRRPYKACDFAVDFSVHRGLLSEADPLFSYYRFCRRYAVFRKLFKEVSFENIGFDMP